MRRNIKLRRKLEISIRVGVIAIISIIAISKYLHQNSDMNEVTLGATEESLMIAEHQIPIIGLSQASIPTGCESVSTVAILNHLGIEITPEYFIEEFLPKQKFYRKNGNVYGPNPNEYFAGDPFQKSSLGCFPNVITKALESMQNARYSGTEHMNVLNLTGTSLSTLVEAYISDDIPVLIWVTIGMQESKEGMTYLLEDGTAYTWRANEHCVVLCGYDEMNYYIMDPLENGKIVSYPKELVQRRYAELGECALVFIANN